MSAPDGPGSRRTLPTFVGPWSVPGVCVGMVAWMLPAFYGGATVWLVALPLSGVPMLVLPLRPVRHLGLGLVASALVWPFSVIGVLALPAILR